jgi:hypothetical protein
MEAKRLKCKQYEEMFRTSTLIRSAESVAIMVVMQLPPRLSRKTDVIIEFRYGICVRALSDSATITFANKPVHREYAIQRQNTEMPPPRPPSAHLLEIMQREVDVLGFLQQGAFDLGLLDALRPSQINQVQLSCEQCWRDRDDGRVGGWVISRGAAMYRKRAA